MSGRPFLLGLTGSIGMGKSTTAAAFAAEGVPVWDADAAVHRLYGPGGAGGAALAGLVPDAIASDGAVDRERLRAAVLAEPALLDAVEARIHPLVAADRAVFIAANAAAPLVVLDIPLLYETGAEAGLDAVLVVSAPAEAQRARVLARPGMSVEAFERILARQVPDAEKRRRADHMIETHEGVDAAREKVRDLVERLTAGKRG
ncbi:dephospho-CoA kinase [Amaricoccus sp.]|uniref:dephospho-CoA kinase n=1 Tax=Amaricoccus sp. TaxID=1872485 RepID=UPI001B6C3BD5|nr:dephospho-CoA kinase [Amaricoccus sp.]MBP7002411.1 dephospho-CoA kinase [Amaricoccus sp.]